MNCRILIASVVVLALAACGGGGGSGPTSTPEDPSSDGGSMARAPIYSDAQSANPNATLRAAGDAAANLPRFGSVTQSSNEGAVAGTTGDAASTSFDGRDVRLTITRTDGSSLSFDSASHGVGRVSYADQLPGYSFRGDALLTYTSTSVSLAAVYVNWNDTDSSDYIAGGYWAHFVGQTDPLQITGAEIGAFVDGPELSGMLTPPSLGTATYRGSAGGFYGYQSAHGSEIGEFSANATLTANFAANTVSGCVGCGGGVVVSGLYETSEGEVGAFSDVVVPVWLRGEATFGPDGNFRSTDVTLMRSDATVTQTNGSWGGQFSDISDNDGDPRLVAGTAGAEWTESDGAEGVFVGAWFGVKN